MSQSGYNPFEDDSDSDFAPESPSNESDLFGDDSIFGDGWPVEEPDDFSEVNGTTTTKPTPLERPRTPAPPSTPQPPAPEVPTTPRIIKTEPDADIIDDPLKNVKPTDFGDFTPQTSRFVAPSADAVLTVPSKQSAHTKLDAPADPGEPKRSKKEQRNNDKIARRAAKVEKKKSEKRLTKQEKTTEKPPKKAAPAPKKRSLTKISTAAAVVVLLGVGAGGLYWMNTSLTSPGESTTASAAEPTTSEPVVTSTTAVPEITPQDKLDSTVAATCERAGGTFADGDTSTPEKTIQGFNYSYFTKKDAVSTATYLDDGLFDSVESLQEGIDHPANGDAFCITISPESETVFDVGVTEFVRPDTVDDEVVSWRTDQTVTVEKQGEAWKIVEQSINTSNA
ncbi:hypothetical protein [Corynebacterium crudilactis]|uniref:DUF8176 domain-containing protein n=1 Tax=Corynebacterium crudilactis TaxID=1652495 RepID=A0A172QXN7_9CORY|nr:hypothetical protein [Corynebacterium crudilactis]ANE05475.1 hypothetical protein ccrud_14130 [Corynebacterium crudilactis]